MTKRRSKLNKREQQVIAAEVVVSQTYLKLKRQIATLKRLPHDFRDITAGTGDWEAFARITGRREEMEAWDNGPILYFSELNKHEEMILGSQNLLRCWQRDKFSSENWLNVIEHATHIKASWIYLPDEETEIINALNVLLSRFDFNVRAKGQLMSEMSGKPVGVVY